MRKIILTLLVGSLSFFVIFPVYAFQPSYQFTDQERDFESGLYNFDARQYNPSIGRFIQSDPVVNNLTNPQKLKEITGQDLDKFLRDPQNLNPYSYTRNNPVKYTDLTGEWFGEFFTGRQSWSSFQSELGEAAMYVNPVMSAAIDHPYITGAAAGILSGALFVGASLMAGSSFICGILCGTAVTTVATQGDKIQKVVDFTSRYGNNLGAKMNQVVQNIGETTYKFSEHSIMRIVQKVGVGNEGRVLNVLNNVKPFEFFHENVWKLGYYDPITKIFVAQVKATEIITTIATNVAQNYINNLIK